MPYGALQLLQGFLGFLKLADLVTTPPGLAVTLWGWLYIALPYDSALALWLIAVVPLLACERQDVQQ
jgi:ABC-type multidrug transport system permease subunit